MNMQSEMHPKGIRFTAHSPRLGVSQAPLPAAGSFKCGLFKFAVCLSFFLFMVPACGTDKKNDLKVGDTAPAFTVVDLKGETVSLESFRGSPAIIRFFVTDCKYCKADTPVFSEYFNKYKKDGLNVLYITTTTDRKLVTDFSDDLQIPFPVIIDKDETVSKLYNIKIVPQTIILSPDQKIISAILGGVGEAELEELVGSYFNKQQ